MAELDINTNRIFGSVTNNGAIFAPLATHSEKKTCQSRLKNITPEHGAFFQNREDVPNGHAGTSSRRVGFSGRPSNWGGNGWWGST